MRVEIPDDQCVIEPWAWLRSNVNDHGWKIQSCAVTLDTAYQNQPLYHVYIEITNDEDALAYKLRFDKPGI